MRFRSNRTIRALWVLVPAYLLVYIPASSAQDATRMEIFAGVSVLRGKYQGRSEDAAGLQGSVTFNFTQRLGFVADFGYQTGIIFSDVSAQEYLFGLRLHSRRSGGAFFAHALAGGGRGRAGSDVVGVPALSFGGGADAYLSRRWGVRGQVDWIPVRYQGEWITRSIRVGAGVIFRFGGGLL